jgi:hypothetical protein
VKDVGVARFELTISWSQTKRDTGLRYTPKIFEGAKLAFAPHDPNVIRQGLEPRTVSLEG